jgi:hypothetical protein
MELHMQLTHIHGHILAFVEALARTSYLNPMSDNRKAWHIRQLAGMDSLVNVPATVSVSPKFHQRSYYLS